uniref:Mediator of RNA polymerase II transcription subunit 20A n=1 Tax=Tanacetum cinerariifolium TaxID=118510 RepID=A0A6L2NFW9_TANCI|nr:mediator of RNA polymerase II transcription subunit 20A [Tanacetum cinerariifolium]
MGISGHLPSLVRESGCGVKHSCAPTSLGLRATPDYVIKELSFLLGWDPPFQKVTGSTVGSKFVPQLWCRYNHYFSAIVPHSKRLLGRPLGPKLYATAMVLIDSLLQRRYRTFQAEHLFLLFKSLDDENGRLPQKERKKIVNTKLHGWDSNPRPAVHSHMYLSIMLASVLLSVTYRRTSIPEAKKEEQEQEVVLSRPSSSATTTVVVANGDPPFRKVTGPAVRSKVVCHSYGADRFTTLAPLSDISG